MTTEAIFLGIVCGFIFYEWVGLSPGGIVVPGYIALYAAQPLALATTLVIVLLTWLAVEGFSRLVILYGRRAFFAAVTVGFLLKWLVEQVLVVNLGMSYELVIIGYIVPGLIANEIRKQGLWETLFSLVIVSGVVKLILQLQVFIR